MEIERTEERSTNTIGSLYMRFRVGSYYWIRPDLLESEFYYVRTRPRILRVAIL